MRQATNPRSGGRRPENRHDQTRNKGRPGARELGDEQVNESRLFDEGLSETYKKIVDNIQGNVDYFVRRTTELESRMEDLWTFLIDTA